MKRKTLLAVMLLVGSMASAQSVIVGGHQSGVWDTDTVRVIADVKVMDSLMIRPGTVVLFDGFYGISVTDGAVFKALGTEEDSIKFTVADTAGFSQYDLKKGGWNGFFIEKAAKVQFNYCVLEYGKAADTTDQDGGAIRINQCDQVRICHSVLRCNRARENGGALSAEHSNVIMTDCSINNNVVYTEDNLFYMYGGALRFLNCDVDLEVMEFKGNDGSSCVGGALSLDSCSVVLDRAVFSDNVGVNGAGLYLMRSNHLKCRLSNLLFHHNLSRHFGGGLAFCDVSPEVYNILVTNNESEGVSCSGIFYYQYCAPKMTNCIVYGNYSGEVAMNIDTVQMWLWTFDDYAPEFRNCLIEGGTKYIRGSEYINVFENIVDGDPLFVDAEQCDFRLSETSPCRNAGSMEVPDWLANGLDLAGNPRWAGQSIDIGPYEFLASLVPQYPSDALGATLVGNPLNANSRIVFDQPLAGNAVVTVFTLTGRSVAQKVFGQECSDILEIGSMVDRLAPGVYLIEVAVNGKVYSLKAVR